MTCNWDQAFWHVGSKFCYQNGLELVLSQSWNCRFKTPCARCSKVAPEHNRASSMFHDSVLFFVCFIFTSVNIELMRLAKKVQFCLLCPKVILPEALWLVNMHFSKFQSRFFMICFQQWSPPRSSSIKSTLAQTVTDGAIEHWCTLTLEFTSNLFGSCSGLFGYHSYYLSLRFDNNFPLEATSREVGYSPVDQSRSSLYAEYASCVGPPKHQGAPLLSKMFLILV